MAIISYTKDHNLLYEYLVMFPDQYVSEKDKEGDDFAKHNMDYFSVVAFSQVTKNRRRFVGNYDLVKGIVKPSDYYEDDTTRSFIDRLEDEVELPSHVKHYPILNPPINTLLGELTKRPDTSRVKAFDEDSKSEELAFRTELLKQYILQRARAGLAEQFAQKGEKIDDLEPEEVEQLTQQKVEDYMTSYTSLAERWGANVLEACKLDFNIKEKSEDAFRDLLICSREFYHIFETTTRSTGLDLEVVNPKNIWSLSTPDKKYSRDWYAGGTIEVMEISEIIDKFPEVSKEEVDHLRKGNERFNLMNARESNLTNGSRAVGINTITYDTYDPLILEERAFIESQLKENDDDMSDYYGMSNNVSNFGNKYAVVRSYWRSKKKVGKVTIYDPETDKRIVELVDENYKSNSNPYQIGEVEWAYMNQWYKGLKIGSDIYHVEPYKLLPYMPIIGVVHELKNTQARSLVDLMKPFQMIYNVCINQLWKLLEKEYGVVYNINIRKVPTPKDADAQDALDIWEMEAREKGLVYEDDSPENMKAPSGNTSLSRAIDLTRTNEMQSRISISSQMKQECWELVGISRERTGSIAATQTATGTNTAISQSYAQTEVYFVQHEYVLNELYQSLLDACQYIQSNKEESTLAYINGDGENQWVKINGSELKLRDLKVFVTSRAKDQRAFEQLQQLSQAALQNGASLYEVAEMYTTDSMRKLKDTLKKLKDKQDAMMQQQQQLEQQKLQQQQEQFANDQDRQEQVRQETMINDNAQKELDRINRERVAIIGANAKDTSQVIDTDANGVPDRSELAKLGTDRLSVQNDYQASLQKLTIEKSKVLQAREMALEQMAIEREKLRLKDKEIESNERVEKIKAKAKSSASKSKK